MAPLIFNLRVFRLYSTFNIVDSKTIIFFILSTYILTHSILIDVVILQVEVLYTIIVKVNLKNSLSYISLFILINNSKINCY